MASDGDGGYVFGVMGDDARTTAEVGRAWMQMLTLQLGILLEPYLPGSERTTQTPAEARAAAGHEVT